MRHPSMRYLVPATLLLLAACGSDGTGTEPSNEVGAISGHVTESNQAVAGAQVALGGGGVQSTDASGKYTFGNLRPGTYSVTLTPPDGMAPAAGEAATKNTTVEAGKTATVDWKLEESNVVVVRTNGATFEPKDITIAKGTTVRWVNGGGTHTVTPDNADQPGAWQSASLGAGQTFEFTFNTAGRFDYHCIPHQAIGMVGSVTVE